MNKKIIAFLATIFLSVSTLAADRQDMEPVNVNQATFEELDQGLLGVGPRIAMEIVKHRDQHGPYQSLDDLDRVKFVGSTILKKNKGRIVFD